MRTFIFTTEYKKSTYCYKATSKVYELVNNEPIYVGECKFNTGSSMGAQSEVLNTLVNGDVLPKDLLELSKNSWRSAGYYCKEVEEYAKIIELK